MKVDEADPTEANVRPEADLVVALFRLMRGMRRGWGTTPGSSGATSREVGHVLGHDDLSPRQMVILLQIASEGVVGVTELSRRSGLGLPAISAAVADLARKGLVERHEDEQDHRRTLVRIAPQQAGVVEALIEHRLGPIGEAASKLGTGRLEELAAGLHALADAIGEPPEDPPEDQRADEDGRCKGRVGSKDGEMARPVTISREGGDLPRVGGDPPRATASRATSRPIGESASESASRTTETPTKTPTTRPTRRHGL